MNTNTLKSLRGLKLERLATPRILALYKIKDKETLAEEVCRYLSLLEASPGTELAPSKAVDAVYHKILHDKAIRARVEKILDGKLTHNPGLKGEALRAVYARTMRHYKKAFGKNLDLDSRGW